MTRPVGFAEALLHGALWQGLWVWLVWAGGRDATLLPLIVAAAVLAASAWRAGTDWWRVLTLSAVGLACGIAVDGSLGRIHLVAYGSAEPGPVPPAWILALWMLFSAAVALPLRRVLRHPVVAGIAGLVGGPLAYLGGRGLDAIAFPSGERIGLAAVAIGFALATPVIVLVANRLLPLPAPPPRPRLHPRPAA